VSDTSPTRKLTTDCSEASDPFPTTNPALSDTRRRAVSQTVTDDARRAQARTVRRSGFEARSDHGHSLPN